MVNKQERFTFYKVIPYKEFNGYYFWCFYRSLPSQPMGPTKKGGQFMRQVKIYDGHPDNGGKVIKIIPETDPLLYEESALVFTQKKKRRKIKCEFCGDKTVVFSTFITICKKSVCVRKKTDQKKQGS